MKPVTDTALIRASKDKRDSPHDLSRMSESNTWESIARGTITHWPEYGGCAPAQSVEGNAPFAHGKYKRTVGNNGVASEVEADKTAD